MSHHKKLQTVLAAQSTINKIKDPRHKTVEDEKEESEEDDDDGPQLMGEAKSATDDVLGMNDYPPDNLDLDTRVGMISADQRHEDGTCQCDIKPLRMFIIGVGGTGKCFLIEAVSALETSIWPDHNLTCAITAPTGLASFIIRGVTVHHLFILPVEHEGRTAGYWSLSKGAQKTLNTLLRHVKVFIVDEVSILSSLNLAYLLLRLEELFSSDEWFGGKNMLFVGDFLQLQPVNGSPVFDKVSQSHSLSG